VTRNDNGYSIVAVGPADGPLRSGATNLTGQALIRHRRSVRDFLELLPNRLLKRRSGRHQRRGKFPKLAREIGLKLTGQSIEMPVAPRRDRGIKPPCEG